MFLKVHHVFPLDLCSSWYNFLVNFLGSECWVCELWSHILSPLSAGVLVSRCSSPQARRRLHRFPRVLLFTHAEDGRDRAASQAQGSLASFPQAHVCQHLHRWRLDTDASKPLPAEFG